jgi:broad specificity phosphatase PhoE
MPSLYVVRHGEPAAAGVLLGRTDPPLSETGRRQMTGVELDVPVFHTSTLRRARESAAICAREREVRMWPELDELSLGVWDGRSWSEIETQWPELAARKLADWTGVVPPGGESWSHFTGRVDRAIEQILLGRDSAAVVAHLTVNAWVAHRMSGANPIGFEQGYAVVYTYAF